MAEDQAKPQRFKFYVSLTWDDWPEGGSFAESVWAANETEAERAVRWSMAESRAVEQCRDDEPDHCAHCGFDEQDGSDICPECGWNAWTKGRSAAEQVLDSYGTEWHLVDCFRIDEFVMQHIEVKNET